MICTWYSELKEFKPMPVEPFQCILSHQPYFGLAVGGGR